MHDLCVNGGLGARRRLGTGGRGPGGGPAGQKGGPGGGPVAQKSPQKVESPGDPRALQAARENKFPLKIPATKSVSTNLFFPTTYFVHQLIFIGCIGFLCVLFVNPPTYLYFQVPSIFLRLVPPTYIFTNLCFTNLFSRAACKIPPWWTPNSRQIVPNAVFWAPGGRAWLPVALAWSQVPLYSFLRRTPNTPTGG